MAGPSDQSESITSQQHGKSVQNSQAIVKDTGTSLELSNSPGVTRRRRMARTDVSNEINFYLKFSKLLKLQLGEEKMRKKIQSMKKKNQESFFTQF